MEILYRRMSGGAEENYEDLNHGSRYIGRYLNGTLPEYESRAISLR
jgi:hypothetical protein